MLLHQVMVVRNEMASLAELSIEIINRSIAERSRASILFVFRQYFALIMVGDPSSNLGQGPDFESRSN